MEKTLTKAVTHRQFLKMCGLAVLGAGASQMVVPPKPASAADETVIGNLYVTGSVGVGTTSPLTRLQVGDGSGTTEMRIYGSQSRYMRIFTDGDGNIDVPVGQLLVVTHDHDIALLSGNDIRIAAAPGKSTQFTQGNVGIGTTSPTHHLALADNKAARIGQAMLLSSGLTIVANLSNNSWYDGTNWQANLYNRESALYQQLSGDHVFFSAPATAGAPSWQEKLRIASTGNVGIGTTSPQAKLDVRGGINATGPIKMADSNGVPYQDNWIGTADNIDGDSKWLHVGGITSTKTGDSIAYRRVALYADRVLVSGNLGVGTTSPGDKLEVAGNIRLNGELWVNSVLAVKSDGVAVQSYYAQ